MIYERRSKKIASSDRMGQKETDGRNAGGAGAGAPAQSINLSRLGSAKAGSLSRGKSRFPKISLWSVGRAQHIVILLYSALIPISRGSATARRLSAPWKGVDGGCTQTPNREIQVGHPAMGNQTAEPLRCSRSFCCCRQKKEFPSGTRHGGRNCNPASYRHVSTHVCRKSMMAQRRRTYRMNERSDHA